MTPGDIPCNAPCRWRWCRWWQDGHCMDNDTCEYAELSAEALCDNDAGNGESDDE